MSVFLNSILGAFGLVSTTVDTLNNLKESKHILDIVKKRHKNKKLNISKKFTKRLSKKAAASAVSAATLGTGAVVITVAGLEVMDYCNELRELHEEDNILFKTKAKFYYTECLNEAKDDSQEIIVAIKEAVPIAIRKTWEETKSISRATWEKTKEISVKTWRSASTISKYTWDTSTRETNEAIESLLDWASELTQ
ncbi:MAG: hypothetical protein ACC657_18515 [Thiohalomonadales bacterium]